MRKNEVNSFKKMLWMSLMVPMLLSQYIFGAVPVKIMPLGDSITHEDYRDATLQSTIPEANRTAYRDDLWYQLQGAGYTISFEGDQSSGSTFMPDDDHQGTGGLKDSEMAANVYGYLTSNPADIVLLHIGTNGEITDNGADDVETTLDEIDRYEADSGNHVQVILAKIINCRPDWVHTDPLKNNICTQSTIDGTTSDSITVFNNAVVAMAETRITNGDDIVIVDMETGAGLVYDATDMIDDLHPNDAGYAKMGTVWYDALVDNIPTHQWKLEEPVQPFIDTYRDANGVCGSLSGVCPTQTTDGIIGNAQNFNGSDSSIDVTDDGTFDWGMGDSFTIEFWIKPDNTTGLQVAMGRHKGTTGSASWWIGRDGNKIKFTLDSAEITSDKDLTAYQWTHVTLIRDATAKETRLYINGEKDANSVTSTTPNNFLGEKPLNIGWFVNAFWFKGALDEVTIYNGILGADQIKQHYDAGTSGITLAITSTPVTSADVDTSYSYTVESNDPSATYSVTDTKGWMEIIDPDVGEITNAVTLSAVGNTDVTATATNNSGPVNQNFTVKVRDTSSLPAGMEHYWKLNEANGATTFIDEYNGDTDATCNAGCPAQVPGIVDQAQDFNGVNPDLDVPNDDSINWIAGDSFTIEFWMKANTLNPTSVLLGRFSGGNMAWWMGIQDGKAHMLFRDSDRVAIELPGSTVTSGTWYHIAAVRDAGNTFKLYVNGQPVNSISDTTTGNFVGTVPITMGYFIDSTASSEFNFDGALDEIAIFKTALPQNLIQSHYNNGLAGNGFDNPDVTAPVITLTGANPQEILVGDAYTELGATANDTVDGDVSINIVIDATAVNTNAVGSYTVSYEVDDTAGNTGTATRTVNVTTGNDPVITLTGDNPYTVEVDSTYVDPGATATDIEDGTIAVSNDSATSVDEAIVGTYTVTYTTTDSHGNTVQTTRTVNVVDTTAPVITMIGGTVNLLLNDIYTEPGVSCTDNYDASCTVVTGGDTVDTSAVGNYTVTYDATDASGNTAIQLTRTVNVSAGNAPVITLIGDNPYIIEVHSTYVDPGATATDIEDGTVIVTNDSATSIDTANLGDQTVTYTATDSHGNTAQATRTVKVLDTTAPVITLTGATPINLLLNDTYTEEGATCTDNYDASCTVVIGGDTVDTSNVGNYTVIYDVTDASGNTATQLTRTVNVIAGNAPVITLDGDNPYIIAVYSTYVDPGASATDIEDGTVTVTNDSATSVDTAIVGTYTVTYTATDSHGNTVQETRTVNVIAGNAPVITLSGDNPYTVEVDSTYVDPGATATDIEDGTVAVTNDSATSVNTAIVGTYTVTYTATDSHGNTVQETRTVNVTAEPIDDWYTKEGDTYTVGDSSVELDPNLFTITVLTDRIVFEENGSDPKIYVRLMNNGEVFTGYTQANVESATVASGFEPGTKVSVDADGIILIETLLTFGLTLGGK